ncbi:AMP-binding protein [Streptomyces tubbatahanensis]|uniref:AMP-binding protein n=1 Tax=Streptomyces tubbatahanensis TaxID=2923272 RepID=A0ABY3XKR4_9ACTN|nr:AMP-binding protein [Streptomyces tubbatahanensis]UNS95027.1 AMP-binding protein [Streptomyces tubbatahanensis]
MTVDTPALTSAGFVHDLLAHAAGAHPGRPSVRDREGAWSYAELEANARRAAQWLDALGVRRGARLLCVLSGGRDFAALLFGAISRGVIFVPVAEDASAYQLEHLLADANPAAVVATAGRVPEIAALTPVPVLAPAYAEVPAEATEAGPVGTPDDPALLIYTSGTTARPKGIVCPHRAVVWATRAIAERVEYQPSDVVYCRVPVSFDYGLYQLFLAVLAGAEVVYPRESASAHELVSIRAAGATVVPVVPTLALLLAQLGERDPRPTSVRLLTNTGAALVGRDADRVRAAFPGAALICMYGMSECKRISIAAPDEDLAYPGTVGRPLSGTRLFVLGRDGEPVARGGVGEIVVAGPHVMDGYWGSAAAEQQRERFVTAPEGAGPALRTGDFGSVDEDGRLYFHGRRDDLFKRRGWRVSCQEVESAALDVAGVEQAACLPPDADGTFTVWTTGPAAPAEVLRGIDARLGPAKTPDRCVPVPRMPLTPNGKLDKAALRAGAHGD